MREAYASGGNYKIEVDGGVVEVEVWRRPDVDSSEGAQFAREKVDHLRALSARAHVRGLLLNLSSAPPVIGPLTQQAILDMMRGFVARRLRVALVASENATQRLQLQRLARDLTGRDDVVFTSVEDARRALRA
jgi:hypothetical protein